MPMALEPDQTFEIVLESDAGKDPPRPAFRARYLSGRQWRRVSEMDERMAAAAGGAAACDVLYDALRLCVAGWRNLINGSERPIEVAGRQIAPGAHVPYSPESLEDVLTIAEGQELLVRCVTGAAGPNEAERKNSPSPSPSAPDESATAAEPDPRPTEAPDA